MCVDKYQSKKNGNRISENTLFIVALVIGAVGIYSGMKYPIYHKASKAKFTIGIPLMIAGNFISVYLVYKSL